MDDLSALDWSTKAEDANRAQAGTPLPSFAALRPTPPLSGRSSPLPKLPSSNQQLKTQASLNDSFSNLVSFSSASTTKNLSLQEQQKKLLEQKAQQQGTRQKQAGSYYSGDNEQFWNNMGSGRSTPTPVAPPSAVYATQFPINVGGLESKATGNGSVPRSITEDEDDILAAFKADAPVDSSSHFPKPAEYSPGPSHARHPTSLAILSSEGAVPRSNSYDLYTIDDDDPFGLAGLPKEHSSKAQEIASRADDHIDNDDDVLGLLGKPVSELPQPQQVIDPIQTFVENESAHPQDQALAELVDMGFPKEGAKEALESTESGTNVQQAVGWLLNKAHSESRSKAGPRRNSSDAPRQTRDPRIDRKSGSRPNAREPENDEFAWSSKPHPDSGQRQRRASPASSNQLDKDPSQMASEFRTAFLKTAGSLWKTSTKKVQQAVQEFNSDSDSSQPKWMREPGKARVGEGFDHQDEERHAGRARRRSSVNKKLESVTDEVMMLESDRMRPPPRKPSRRQEPSLDSSADNSRDHSPALPSRLRQDFPAQPAFLRQREPKPLSTLEPKPALNRQTIDDQASQAYVSSARRRKPAAKPPAATPKAGLLESVARPGPSSTSQPITNQPSRSKQSSQLSTPMAPHPAAPVRHIPPISSIALQASHADRKAGNDHFKRGDFSAAHLSYTSSLKHLPANHPLTIILLTNRALTALKIGEPKTALSDTETAITVIGPSRGEAEKVDLNNGEPPKLMRDYLGKALMRKAEALEQMEKWKDAAVVWKEAVEGGHGGPASIQGRLRCEKAAAPQQINRAKPLPTKKPVTPIPNRFALSHVNGTIDGPSAEAVNKLREANAAADRVDDEKFALADTVDAKIAAWKGGKADNLRALLGSLDSVLWPEAGWKKIGMAELVLPAKVKVQYMKGIGKVHPDKLSTAATTEQIMIAGAVFSTLNEAWDRFKTENGL